MTSTTYQQTEILYPDFSGLPDAYDDYNNSKLVPRVYNYNPTLKVHPTQPNYFVYEPAESGQVVKRQSTYYLEDILRKNPTVWQAYISGKFDVHSCLDDNCRKIILKEKTSNKNSDFVIKKYKVRVHHCKKNKELLLVSFSNNNNSIANLRSQTSIYPQSRTQYVDVNLKLASNSVSNVGSRRSSRVKRQPPVERIIDEEITGPGSELVAELVEGRLDDEDIILNLPSKGNSLSTLKQAISSNNLRPVPSLKASKSTTQFVEPDVNEIVDDYFIEQSRSNISVKRQPSTHALEDPTFTQGSNQDSFDDEYIKQFAPTASLSKKSSRSNSRLTGSVKKVLHLFKQYEEHKRSESKLSQKSQKTAVSPVEDLTVEEQTDYASDNQVYVYPKSQTQSRTIPALRTTPSTRSAQLSKKTLSKVEKVSVYDVPALSQTSGKQKTVSVVRSKASSVQPKPTLTDTTTRDTPLSRVSVRETPRSIPDSTPIDKNMFAFNSTAVTPAPPNPFAFISGSPVSESQFEPDAARETPDSRLRPESASQYDNGSTLGESGAEGSELRQSQLSELTEETEGEVKIQRKGVSKTFLRGGNKSNTKPREPDAEQANEVQLVEKDFLSERFDDYALSNLELDLNDAANTAFSEYQLSEVNFY